MQIDKKVSDLMKPIESALRRRKVSTETFSEVYNRACEAVIQALEPQWVIVSVEGLPKIGGQYLVSVDLKTEQNFPDRKEHQVYECTYMPDYGFFTANTVMAWMPMPEGVS